MSTWIYQMSETKWKRVNFLRSVHEGRCLTWDSRKVIGDGFPAPYDQVILFYAKSHTEFPGICGAGRIIDSSKADGWVKIDVRKPTNKLRQNPWWDGDVVKIMEKIRGKRWRATIFPVSREVAQSIEDGISRWLRNGR